MDWECLPKRSATEMHIEKTDMVPGAFSQRRSFQGRGRKKGGTGGGKKSSRRLMKISRKR